MATERARVASESGGALGGPRLVVPDVLRGFAIFAMLVAHATPLVPATPLPVAFVMANLNDLASPLFALVMGMSSQIVMGRTPRADRVPMFAQQVFRGLVLIALGVWMGYWSTWVAIVLSYLGVLLIVGLPFLLLSTRWLIAAAAALAVLSEPLNVAGRSLFGWTYADPTGISHEFAFWITLGPSYRLVNLLPFFLLGALLLRHGFVRDRLLWTLAAIAPLAFVAKPLAEIVTGEHPWSGSYPDTAQDLGLVLAVYVSVVVLSTVRGVRARQVADAVFLPLRAIGAVALSLYVLHVWLLAVHGPLRPAGNDGLWWLIIVPGVIAAGWAWWRFVGPGPVEWLLGWVSGRPKRR